MSLNIFFVSKTIQIFFLTSYNYVFWILSDGRDLMNKDVIISRDVVLKEKTPT